MDSIRITSISSSANRESRNTEKIMGFVLIVEWLCVMIRTRRVSHETSRLYRIGPPDACLVCLLLSLLVLLLVGGSLGSGLSFFPAALIKLRL